MATRRRRKFDEIVTPPLFDDEVEKVERRRTQRRAPAVAHGSCPCCSSTRVAVERQGAHLVWRLHAYRTWSNAPLVCRASGVALHDARPLPLPDLPSPACACGR